MNNSQNEVKENKKNTNDTKKGFIKSIAKETWSKIAIILSAISIVLSMVALITTISHRRPVRERNFAYDRPPRIEQGYQQNFEKPNFDRQIPNVDRQNPSADRQNPGRKNDFNRKR